MNVAVDAVVDPDLIGGVLAKVGSTVYDGTVKIAAREAAPATAGERLGSDRRYDWRRRVRAGFEPSSETSVPR